MDNVGSLAAVAHGVGNRLSSAGLAPGAPVGLVLRNDPAMIAAMLGVLLARCCIVTLNPSHGDEGLGHDMRDLRLPAVVACGVDWDRAGVKEAATGALGLRVSVTDRPVEVVTGLESPATGRSANPIQQSRWRCSPAEQRDRRSGFHWHTARSNAQS